MVWTRSGVDGAAGGAGVNTGGAGCEVRTVVLAMAHRLPVSASRLAESHDHAQSLENEAGFARLGALAALECVHERGKRNNSAN